MIYNVYIDYYANEFMYVYVYVLLAALLDLESHMCHVLVGK